MKLLALSNTDWYLYNYRMPIDKILRQHGYEVVLVCPPGPYVKKMQEAGFRWIPLTMSRSGLNVKQEAATIRRITAIYREEKPDIVHHFTIKCNLYGGIAARLAKVPVVVDSIAGLGYIYASSALKAQVLRPMCDQGYRLAMRRSKVIFQNSDDLQNFTQRRYVADKNAFLIKSSGVDLSLFSPTPFPDTPPTVLLGSRMLWTKGIKEFVEAARIVKKSYPEARFVLVGKPDPGNPASIPEAQMHQWVEEGTVQWLGFQTNMPELISRSHLICFPSKHTEGTPKFLVEAAASGRPIITTKNRGCKEVVREGGNGLLVPKGDSEALAQAIVSIISHQELMHAMGKASRLLAETEFDLTQVAEQTHQVYQSAIQEKYHQEVAVPA